MRLALVLTAALALAACDRPDGSRPDLQLADLPPTPNTPPAWAAEAVWYEVVLDRFRDGDPANDPTPAALAGLPFSEARLRAAGWRPSAWTSDWYAQAGWERALGDVAATIPARRYGGDLQGVLDVLPSLDTLGVTALALGPVADPRAPHHVDPHLGPDPEGDRERMALEDPDDPETWATTAADRLLLDLLEAAHQRGLRVVPDLAWPRPPADDTDAAVTQAIAVRWLDPDGDGDPADGVDGFRLPAEREPLAFWRDLRRVVKTVHPEALLVGVFEGEAPQDPARWLDGTFDAVVYDWAFRTLRPFLAPAGPHLTAAQVAARLSDLYAAVPPDHLPALWSAAGGPDAPRLATALLNATRPDDAEETPRAGYDVSQPGRAAYHAVRLYRLLQATLPGAPHVFYGDEVGMWGADAPDSQKPMVWDDRDYAPEAALPGGTTRTPDPVVADADLRAFTRRALSLRRDHADLFARGTLTWTPFGDVLRFERRTEQATAVVVVNLGDGPQRTGVAVDGAQVALHVGPQPADDGGAFLLAPRAGAVFLVVPDREL